MKKLMLTLTTAAVLLVSLSCTPVVLGDELKSDKPYNTSPEASSEDLETLVGGNTEFALDLYQQIKDSDDNLFYSPYSISLALAMTYAGARGVTRQEMRDVLHFDLDDAALHAAFNQLTLELASRGQDDDQGFQFNIANAIWGQQGFDFLDEFLDTLAENYDAGLRIADFLDATEESRQIINQWVSDQTEGKIEELIAEGDLDPATVLVLTNAIYFKAEWYAPFAEEETHDATFTRLDGSTVTVPMMEQSMSFACAEGDNYQAIEMKYQGHDFSMVVLLPREGHFEEFEASMDAQKVEAIIDSLEGEAIILSMPKFSYDNRIDLEQTLADMGMPSAFGNADFSGISENSAGLYIYGAKHESFVSVDEKGTEAAAASYVAIAGLSDNEFTMDRPFIYLIRDIETGTILFIERVLDPGTD